VPRRTSLPSQTTTHTTIKTMMKKDSNKMTMRRIICAMAALLLPLGGLATTASATVYGNFMDPTGTVSYLNVEDVNGLFGAPTVSLNSLDFTPTEYEAQCSACPTGVTTADILTLDVQATGGQQINEVEVNEGLDYSLQSFDPTGFASVIVTATITIDITEVNGQSVNNISEIQQVIFDPANNVTVSGIGIDDGVIIGSTGAISIQQILLDNGVTGEATRVRIGLDNTLRAFHDGSGGLAHIRKRDTDFVSLTINGGNPVPEPSTALLMMGGLALLARRRRGARA